MFVILTFIHQDSSFPCPQSAVCANSPGVLKSHTHHLCHHQNATCSIKFPCNVQGWPPAFAAWESQRCDPRPHGQVRTPWSIHRQSTYPDNQTIAPQEPRHVGLLHLDAPLPQVLQQPHLNQNGYQRPSSGTSACWGCPPSPGSLEGKTTLC